MSNVWEPWVPVVGQRVRVLSRPECWYCREDHDAEVGATGVVSKIKNPEHVEGEPGGEAHRFWVLFDDPSIAERTVSRTEESHFAALELEPVQ